MVLPQPILINALILAIGHLVHLSYFLLSLPYIAICNLLEYLLTLLLLIKYLVAGFKFVL